MSVPEALRGEERSRELSLDSRAVEPRRPWIAGVLSFLLPGLGQLYAGSPGRGGIVWVLSAVGIAVAVELLTYVPGRPGLLAGVVLGLATHLLPAWDAGRIARRGVSYRVRGYNRPVIYVALLLVSIFVWNPAYRSFIQARIGRAYWIPSAAMEPTIMLDDYIMSSPRRWPIARGDIVILRAGGVTITKRAVGLPGDTIAMLDGRLRIGTVMSPEPYATRDSTDPAYPELGWQKSHLAGGVDSASYQPSLHNWGPLVVPTNHYFVLGDNRSNSLDSREFGFISRDSIVGRPMTVYFSRDTSTHTIRWERIGRSLSR